MITGYLSPNDGRIRIGGRRRGRRSGARARRLIGYMPESVPLYRETARRGVPALPRAAQGRARASKVAAHVGEALELANIADVRHRIIGQLSKGYARASGWPTRWSPTRRC